MNTISGDVVRFDAEASQNVTRLGLLHDAVNAVVIADNDDFAAVASTVQQAQGIAKELEAKRMEITRPLDVAKRRTIELFARPLAIADGIVAAGKAKMLAWSQKLERERKEAEAAALRSQEAAQRAQRAAAEQARREADERAAAERRAAQEAAAATKAEATAAIESAVAAGDIHAAGAAAERLDKAELTEQRDLLAIDSARDATIARADAPIPMPAVAVHVPPPPKVAGVAVRTLWRAEVTDLAVFVAAAAERHARGDGTLLALLEVNPAKLRALAGALREHANIPGVRVYSEGSVAAAAAK